MRLLAEHFQMLARYNTRANEHLYAACSRLTDTERRRRRHASFGSIHATMNHILRGDRIWMTRFEGGEAPSAGLGDILYDDFNELRAAREVEDARIETFMMALDDAFLAGSIGYVNNQGKRYTDPVPLLLAHFFNHQTHHRGQVHVMLREAGVKALLLDMHRLIRP